MHRQKQSKVAKWGRLRTKGSHNQIKAQRLLKMLKIYCIQYNLCMIKMIFANNSEIMLKIAILLGGLKGPFSTSLPKWGQQCLKWGRCRGNGDRCDISKNTLFHGCTALQKVESDYRQSIIKIVLKHSKVLFLLVLIFVVEVI